MFEAEAFLIQLTEFCLAVSLQVEEEQLLVGVLTPFLTMDTSDEST